MASIYETIGHGAWVDAQEAVGVKVPEALREVKPATPKVAAPHSYGDCAHGASQCKRHRKVYRAMLAKRKAQTAAAAEREARDGSVQAQLNRMRMARVATAGFGMLPLASRQTRVAPAPSAGGDHTPRGAVNVFCERSEHLKCAHEAKGHVSTRWGRVLCTCECHNESERQTPDVTVPTKSSTKVRLRWASRTKATDGERVTAQQEFHPHFGPVKR